MKITKQFVLVSLLGLSLGWTSCKKEPTATKVLMQGNWELTAATDAAGNDILGKVAFPVTVIQLTDDNGMLGTHAPLATRIVYGDSKWTTISGRMNQVFDYANLRLNTGEYFVGEGVVDNFTVEFKLQATAIAGGVLTDILNIMGVGGSWLQQTVYHKFTNVKITIPGQNDVKYSFTNSSTTQTQNLNTMIWEFTDNTQAFYNYKDAQGNLVLWGGWPVAAFSKGKYTWTKKVEGVNDLVKARL